MTAWGRHVMDSVHIRNRLPFLLFVFSTALQDQKCIWGGLFSLIGGLEYNEFPSPVTLDLRQAGENWLQLVDDLLLNSYIIDSSLVGRISRADCHKAAAAPQQDDIGFPW
jgi:hypothetical protein